MPTSSRTGIGYDYRVDIEAKYMPRLTASIKKLVKVTSIAYWETSDDVQFLHNQKFLRPKVKEMMRRGYCMANNIPWDGKTNSKEYNNFSPIVDRILDVGMLPKTLYDTYRASGRSFYAVWAEVTGNSKGLDRALKKDTKKALDDAHKKMLQKKANEGDVEAQKELATMSQNEKPNKEVKSVTYQYDEWKEWKKTARYYIKQEPRRFYNFILTLTNEEVLNSGWGRLAKREIEFIDVGH